MSTDDAAVVLRSVTKRYGTRTVLDGLDLTIDKGSFVAIIGRSGCGKSTLLRLVAGLENQDAGALLTHGAATNGRWANGSAREGDAAAHAAPDVSRGPCGQSARAALDDQPARTRIMFQDARLLPWKTVLANVMLGLPRSARDEARTALDEVGLGSREDDWPAQLSGGQRQRVALARALVHRPNLLLLDEPLGALDALTRMDMQELIERLWHNHGFTAMLVTHDVHEAVALAQRIVLIERGRIALDLDVTLPRPRVRATADFTQIEADVLERVLHPAAHA